MRPVKRSGRAAVVAGNTDTHTFFSFCSRTRSILICLCVCMAAWDQESNESEAGLWLGPCHSNCMYCNKRARIQRLDGPYEPIHCKMGRTASKYKKE